jgi:hypothetical protein
MPLRWWRGLSGHLMVGLWWPGLLNPYLLWLLSRWLLLVLYNMLCRMLVRWCLGSRCLMRLCLMHLCLMHLCLVRLRLGSWCLVRLYLVRLRLVRLWLVRLCCGSLWLCGWPRSLRWSTWLLFRLALFFLFVLRVRRDNCPEEQKQSSGDAGLS